MKYRGTIFDRFFARAGSNGLNYDFLSIRLTKDCIYNFGKTYFRKVSALNREGIAVKIGKLKKNFR